jgi:hypothetical protein
VGWQAEKSLPPAFNLLSCLAYSLTLEVETYFTETLVDFQCLIPEDNILQNHCLNSYIFSVVAYVFVAFVTFLFIWCLSAIR